MAADPKQDEPPSWGAGTGTGSGTGAACIIATLIAKAVIVALRLKNMTGVFSGNEFEVDRIVSNCCIFLKRWWETWLFIYLLEQRHSKLTLLVTKIRNCFIGRLGLFLVLAFG